MRLGPALLLALCTWCMVRPADAQQQTAAKPPTLDTGYSELRSRGDVIEGLATGGVRYVDPASGLDVRADSAILVLDQESFLAQARRAERDRDAGGLPRRGPPVPGARRAFGERILRERLQSFLSSARREQVTLPPSEADLSAFRSVYLEGDVAVVQSDVETMRASSLFYSVVDDRAVLRDVVLRLTGRGADDRKVQVTVRAPELVRQGTRIVGRNVSVTTCPAGEPQWEVFSTEVEILERGEEFEVRTKDNSLALFRTRVLPIPNQTWFTGEQSSFPIQGAQLGYSKQEGAAARIVLGSTMNGVGGAIHHALTGKPADEFRGEWRLGLGWIEARGFPVDADLNYRGGDSYFGRTRAFGLDDHGQNIRDIKTNIDGSPITEENRWLAQTQNRLAVGDGTTVDLTWFGASDPAV